MRFLLVDDEPLICVLLRRAAEDCGFEVEIATRADAFKAAFEARKPDVVALDLGIPGCDGIELMRYLAATDCQAQIIVVSGFGNQMLTVATHLGKAQGLKMAGTISKPMRVAQMRSVLDAARASALLGTSV